MKKSTNILFISFFLLMISFCTITAQILNVESYKLGPGRIYNGFVDNNDNIVLASSNGIHIYSDSTIINTLSSRDFGRVYEGRFGNIIYGFESDSIINWNQGNEMIFVIDSPTTMVRKGVSKLIQMADSKFFLMDRNNNFNLMILDAINTDFIPNIQYSGVPYKNDGPIIEYQPNKFFFRSSRAFQVISTYNYNTNTLIEIKDNSYSEIPNAAVTYSKGPGSKIYIMHSQGFVTWENSQITHSITNQSAGITFNFSTGGSSRPQYFSATSPLDDRMYVVSKTELYVYDGDTVYSYDSLDGFRIPFNTQGIQDNDVIGCDFTSNGTLYVYGKGPGNSSEAMQLSKFDTSPIASLKTETISLLKIYPNPANDIIHINAKSRIESIEVLSMASGKVLYEYQNIDSNEITLKTYNWKRGMYLFKVKGANSLSVHKQIVE